MNWNERTRVLILIVVIVFNTEHTFSICVALLVGSLIGLLDAGLRIWREREP